VGEISEKRIMGSDHIAIGQGGRSVVYHVDMCEGGLDWAICIPSIDF